MIAFSIIAIIIGVAIRSIIVIISIITISSIIVIIAAVAANPRANIVDFGGFDSGIILILRGGIPRHIGDFLEVLTQAMLVGVMLVGRLGIVYVNSCYMNSLVYDLCCYANNLVTLIL